MAGVAIIGAGHGGAQLAASLRQEGYQEAITLIASEPDFPYHKPPLSKAFLKAESAAPQLLRPENFYPDNNVTCAFGETITAVDTATKSLDLLSGRKINFDTLVFATGANPRRLALPGAEAAGVHYLRTMDDAKALRARLDKISNVVVIGGGFIGLELAATFGNLGRNVTVLEMAPRLMGRAVSVEISAHVLEMHRAAGIKIHLGVVLDHFATDGKNVTGVVLADGTAFAADTVIVGIGAIPNDGLASAAGLNTKNGITVNNHLQTTAANIYALGDCASYDHWQSGVGVRLESVQNATDQARHVAKAILGKPVAYRDVPWFWTEQSQLKLQMAGLSIGADETILSGKLEDGNFSVFHLGKGKLLAVDSANRTGDHMMARRMLAEGFTPSRAAMMAGTAAMKAEFMPSKT